MGIRINKELENNIINDYNNGYGTNYISEKYNLHRSTVQRCLQRNNINLRRVSPHSHYNIHFFDTYTPESCYWAGFIAADGYIRDDRDATIIHLCNNDISHLHKIKELTLHEGNISNSQKECSIVFSGKWFRESLYKNFELTPRKTYHVLISEKIPNDMLKHFIRGYFDGDGCISDMKGYPQINFSSGSEMILKQLIDIFQDMGIHTQSKDGQPKIHGIQIDYKCSNAMKILKWMYEESTYLTRLDRKYNKYLSYLNKKYDKIKYD